MKFTLSWLKEHLETKASLEEICDKLTMIGLEVEDVFDPKEIFDGFVVGEVLSAERHPDADKLQILKVNNGTEELQIVCGAPNARAGMKGVFAPVGAYVPGIDFTLTKAKIRGVESSGMMCSGKELEISDDHEGIMDLTTDAGAGTPIVDVLGLDDPVIEIYITPNRSDALGVIGVARDLAAAGLGTLKPGAIEKVAVNGNGNQKIGLKFDGEKACPVFAGRVVTGVKNGPSPEWMQQRLKAIGLRPINALVDITNYISYDYGRPLHVYDADKLQGEIHARFAKEGESFVALDETIYKLDAEMCVIADDSGVLGLGGIMGGESTGSNEDTQNVFIESAWFDPINIAMTGRKIQLNSDARYRFERGVDPSSVLPGLEMATKMVLDICGGEAGAVESAGDEPLRSLRIDFEAGNEVSRLSGMQVETNKIADILQTLGFKIADENQEAWKVSVPEWRPDVHGSADLVEEVVRIIGVDAIENVAIERPTGVARPVLTYLQRKTRKIRSTMAANGMVETINWSFITEGQAKRFGGGRPELVLDNPISTEMSHMRPSLLPGLLAAAERNAARGLSDTALFEIGNCYFDDTPDGQQLYVAGIRCGKERRYEDERSWHGSQENVSFIDAKADFMAALDVMGISESSVQFSREVSDWYHPGRAGRVQQGPKRQFGWFGELHPALLADYSVGPVVAFEFNLSAFNAPKNDGQRTKSALVFSDLPPVHRDFAFVVDNNVAAEDVVKSAASAHKKLISNISVFDVFQGGNLGVDKKSLGIEVTLQPLHETLKDKEIEAVSEKIVQAVLKKTGGELR